MSYYYYYYYYNINVYLFIPSTSQVISIVQHCDCVIELVKHAPTDRV